MSSISCTHTRQERTTQVPHAPYPWRLPIQPTLTGLRDGVLYRTPSGLRRKKRGERFPSWVQDDVSARAINVRLLVMRDTQALDEKDALRRSVVHQSAPWALAQACTATRSCMGLRGRGCGHAPACRPAIRRFPK